MASLDKSRRVYLFAAQLLVLIYIVAGFYPFHLKTLSNNEQINGAIALPNQGVQFRAPGIAYTERAPSWLRDAIATSRFEVSLEIRSADKDQYGPARIFTVSSNRFRRNFTVSQWGTNLSVRIRTPYTRLNGTPSYVVKKVFTDSDWHQIDVRVTPGAIEIRVDGDTTVVAEMPDRLLSNWDPDYRLALGNELSGDRPWLGDIRKATVRIGKKSIDYLATGALRFPERFTLKNSYTVKLIPFVDYQHKWVTVQDWMINLLGFVPFGWLVVMLRWPRPSAFLAIVLSAGVSIMIETGQLLIFADRFPSTEDIIMNTLGAALGALLAKRSIHQPNSV